MAFGFSTYQKTATASKAPKKSTPKSVQDIIDRATAAATGAGMPIGPAAVPAYAPGANVNLAGLPKITPAAQTQVVTGSPVTGAGFAAGAGVGGYPTPPTGSYGGGSVTPANGPGGTLNPSGTDAYNGWMSRFNPAAFQSQVYNDPQLVLNAMWKDLGLNTSSPLYTTLRSLNNADPLSLFLLTSPGATAADLNGEAYGNFLHNLYGTQMTPGGRTIDFREALNNLKGVGNQSGLAPDQQSALYQQLSQGGPAEQFRTYYGLAQDAAKMSLPPAIAAAFLDALARQGDTYLTASATGNGATSPFFQYSTNPMG